MTRFGAGFIGSGGAAGNDSFTKLMLHLNGANGATTFPDTPAGASPHTFAAFGGAAISTTASKFGGSSLLIPSAGFIFAADNADYTVGNNAWTMEGWFNPNGNSGTYMVLGGQQPSDGNTNNTSIYMYRSITNKMILQAYGPGITNTFVIGTSNITGTSFVHVRGLRVGNIMRLFINGVQEGGDVARTGAVNDSTAQFRLGSTEALFAGASFYIQEFKFDVGIARDGGNAFTPPISPYM